MQNYEIGQKVFIDASSSTIGFSAVKVSTGKIKAISKTGVIKVSVLSRNGVDRFDMSFLANGRERGQGYGGSHLISEESYLELKARELYQNRQRLVSQRVRDLEQYVSPHKQAKAEMLQRIEALRLAVEAL